jgi:predicted enzyme related to lactoylglutathione lyase
VEIDRVLIVSIPVSDQGRAKQFYAEVLGFTVVRDAPYRDGGRWIQVQPPGGGTDFTLTTWYEQMPPGTLQGVVLSTADVRAARDTLAERGLDFKGDITSAPWGSFVTFSDPDGNGFVLQQSAG